MRSIAFCLLLVTGYFTDAITANFLECETKDDCGLPEATCTNNLCRCPIGKTFSTDGTKCLELVLRYGDPCTDDAQCAPLLGKNQCKSGTCLCQTGYRYYHGMCIQAVGLGKRCSKNEDCFVSNDLFAMICSSSSVCECNEDYYPRGNYDCRPLAKEGEACAMDSDCQLVGYCNNGCVSKIKNSTKRVINVVMDDVTFLTATRGIGGDCNTNEDCADDTNSYCSPLSKKCACKRGYVYNAQKGCVGELGVDVGCTVNADCTTSPKLCKDRMCICPTSHYYAPGLDKCVKAAFKVNDKIKCVTDQACEVLGPNAECVGEDDRVCKCKVGTKLNEDFLCADSVDCRSEEDCDIINSMCNIKGKCVCPDDYRLDEDICLPNLGATCDETTRKCLIENSQCDSNRKCSCAEGYLQMDPLTCVKKAAINDECLISEQCVEENTECINGICQCTANYLEIGGACIQARAMGDYCTNVLQCHVILGANVLCRNSKCQCAADTKLTEDKIDCTLRSLSVNVHQNYRLILLLSSLLACYLFRE